MLRDKCEVLLLDCCTIVYNGLLCHRIRGFVVFCIVALLHRCVVSCFHVIVYCPTIVALSRLHVFASSRLVVGSWSGHVMYRGVVGRRIVVYCGVVGSSCRLVV